MRKSIRNLVCLALALGLILLMTACGQAGSNAESDSSAKSTEQTSSQTSSVEEQTTPGQTDEPADETLADDTDETGADLFEVLPEDDHYPMTYAELTDVAKQEQNEKARPAYAGDVPDLSQYDTIFIGAPVWRGDWPMNMYTFFEENTAALSGKTLIPFSTHEGSGLSGFDKKLSAAVPDSTVLKGFAARGNDCQNDQENVRKSVQDWIAECGVSNP